jgi:hypothetical protein
VIHQSPVTDHQSQQIVQICSWCLPRTIRVLGAPLGVEAAARISFELDDRGFPKSAHTIVAGVVHDLKLSHGICPDCARRFHHAVPSRVQ